MNRERTIPAVDLARLVWVGPITVLVSVAAVLAVRFIAVAVLRPDVSFKPLGVAPAVIDTTVLVTLAVVVFRRVVAGGSLTGPLLGLLGALSTGLSLGWDPVEAYRRLAFRVLLVSFLPDIAIALADRRNWPYALALAAMHVAAWAVCVPMLTRLTAK